MKNVEINDQDKDILKEIASIGMGHASTALAQLLNTKVTIELPDIKLITVRDIPKYFSETEILLGVILKILGDIKGKLLYLFKRSDANTIITLLNENHAIDEVFTTEEIKVSTIKEMSNILSGSYLNALAKFLDFTIIPSIPHLAMDTAASIFGLASLSEEENMQMILIRSKLSIFGGKFEAVGTLILQLKKSELFSILNLIKSKYT